MEHASTNVARQAFSVEEFSTRVREAAKELNLSANSLGGRLGIPPSTASNYWKGVRPWPLELLPALAAELSTDVNTLLGVGHIGGALSAQIRRAFSPKQDADALDLVEVHEIDLAYGLGGTFSDGPVETQILHFPRSWLETITKTPPSQLTFARGRGDSMMPTLLDGDIVLIDRSQRTVREQDAIWAFTVGDIAMIKRLRVRNERVHILSDNDRVPADEAHPDEVNVVGRVVFIGRRI